MVQLFFDKEVSSIILSTFHHKISFEKVKSDLVKVLRDIFGQILIKHKLFDKAITLHKVIN